MAAILQKWRPGDIKMATRGMKMAMASTFVEQFHRLWGLWMCLTANYKRMELNFRNSRFLGGGWGKGVFFKSLWLVRLYFGDNYQCAYICD